MNCGSLESLNCRQRCGCSPCAFQMRLTALALILAALAIMSAVQCVVSPGGLASVSAPTRSATSGPSGGMREGRVLSRSSPAKPASAKRSCQRQTQVLDLAVRRMISAVPTPSALSSTISARQTCFCGLLRSLISAVKRARSIGETVKDTPVRMPQTRMRPGKRESQVGLLCQMETTSRPAATSGEMNLTSMNGERRMRLTERYMDPPREAMPDCLIAARIANHMERVLRAMGDAKYADQFKGFDWKTEEDAFMDGYPGHEKGGEFVTYERLRAMGTNGFQEPATDFKDGKIIGTKRLFTDGKFGGKDGKATFMETQWRGLQAPGKEQERKKWPFLINNGRSNINWQNAYLDQDNEFVMDRMPYPYIQMNPDDIAELKFKQGARVEVYNDNGSTQAMVYPTPTAKRKQTFMLFAYPTGVQGNVVSPGVNEFIIPNYKQTWGNIRKLADAPEGVKHLSFKSLEYTGGSV